MATPWIRIQSALLAAVLITALAVNLLLRRPVRRVYQEYAVLALNLALWFLGDALFALFHFDSPITDKARLLVAAAVPLTLSRFLQQLMEDDGAGAHGLQRTLATLGVLCGVGVVLSPDFVPIPWGLTLTVVFVYVFLGVLASLLRIWHQLSTIDSLSQRGRVKSLLVAGGIAASAVFLDYLPGVGYYFFGNIFVMLFLYFLFQIIIKLRLFDLYEFLGRSVVTLTFALVIAAIFLFLTAFWRDRADLFVFNTIIGALVIIILFEPLNTSVTSWISRFLFGERFAFVARLERLQSSVAKVVEAPRIAQMLTESLDESRRVTHASVYLLSNDARRHEVASFVGSEPPRSLDLARERPMLELLEQDKLITLEGVEDILKSLRFVDTLEAQATRERYTQIRNILDDLYAAVVVPFVSNEQVIGFLVVNDDRLREPYASEEISMLHKVATQACVSLENSNVYAKLRERDRLAALGEMSAGLAHEIRNPLSAIKGAAQVIIDPGPNSDPATRQEMAEVIADEVDRLNVVVTQFLHFAKPFRGRQQKVDLNQLIKKSVQLIGVDRGPKLEMITDLDPALPMVWTDPELVRTILTNLALNAIEAMDSKGILSIRTFSPQGAYRLMRRDQGQMVTIQFQDTGPGISKEEIDHIFIPFYTTKSTGSGLGLSICQRIIKSLGGYIEVQCDTGAGCTFSVHLPVRGFSTSESIPIIEEPDES